MTERDNKVVRISRAKVARCLKIVEDQVVATFLTMQKDPTADHTQGILDAMGEVSYILRPPPKAPKVSQSRAARWERACAQAEEALVELEDLQGEFQDWLDNLPENLQSSALGEKLQAVVDLDIQGAKGTVEEAQGCDLPQGFGRD